MASRYQAIALALVLFVAVLAQAEWNVAGYIGAAHTQNSTLNLDLPGRATALRFQDVPWTGESFQSPLYYGVRGGYFFSRHFGIQAEFIHLKAFAQNQRTLTASGTLNGVPVSGPMPVNSVVQRFSISHGNNLLLGDFVARQDFWRNSGDKLGRLILSARIGVGGSIPHPESTILGVGDEHYQGGSPAEQLAGGAELRLLSHVYVMGEYKFTHNNQHVRVAEGTAQAVLNSHHVVTGISVHF